MASLQARMLDAAADAVAPGGLLVYSTCTLEPEENEQNVADFLSRHAEYSIERTRAVPAEYLKEDGSLHVTPQDTGFDGSFAARMRRAT
jgi:16S rRNA (cytosine967-C5)-methyltransferase